MATVQASEFVRLLRAAFQPREWDTVTDAQLLEAFVGRREQAALGALVRRHAPMVWGVCRRLLSNRQDAEDAFQATFLVLVRRAASVVPREAVAGWLHGVARHTALKARAATARRRVRERAVGQLPEPSPQRCPRGDLRELLDEELSHLPARYRAVLVLSDLEGLTRKEAALQLGVAEGTVASRLARARALLARRLSRSGVVLPGGSLAAALAQDAASAGVPPAVLAVATDAAALVAEGVLKAMLLTRLKAATAAVLLVLAVGAGLGTVRDRTHAGEVAESPPTPAARQKPLPRAAEPPGKAQPPGPIICRSPVLKMYRTAGGEAEVIARALRGA